MHSASRIAEEWEGRGGHMVSMEKRNWRGGWRGREENAVYVNSSQDREHLENLLYIMWSFHKLFRGIA